MHSPGGSSLNNYYWRRIRCDASGDPSQWTRHRKQYMETNPPSLLIGVCIHTHACACEMENHLTHFFITNQVVCLQMC